jgi:predicted glutamine amidotransferase
VCIIIHKPATVTLPLSTVLRAYQRNDDGWGLIARTSQGLHVRRDFGSNADGTLLDAFASLQEYEVTLHCRIGTSGNLSILNTHPFDVQNGLWLFHNGVFDIDRSADLRYCDTFHVARWLQSIFATASVNGSDAIRDENFARQLDTYAKTSKLVFVDECGVVIVNERLGYWEDGCWFSNESADINYRPVYRYAASARTYGACEADSSDDISFVQSDEVDDYDYRSIVPRSYRVDTPDDEDRLYLEARAFIEDCQKLEVDEIAERCFEDPEIAAESFSVLLQERQTAAYSKR